MKPIHKLLVGAMLVATASASAVDEAKMNQFIDDLMSRMTLQEKLGQINLPPSDDFVTGEPQSSNIGAAVAAGAVGGTFNIKGAEKIRQLQEIAVNQTRLGIPLIVGMDVIHGYETLFPIPLAMAASWDTEAVERAARVAAVEASAGGICWTFSPMVDLVRDPRWGRVSESAGEDPYLGCRMAEAMVRGYQGKDMSRNDEIMACVKHFALYGATESGRDYNTVDMSHNRMLNEYLPPYRAAVDAGVGSLMTSFNLVDGIPATANKWLLTDVLREQWGFDGLVVTDYASINEMTAHGISTPQVSAATALRAGTDMDMSAYLYLSTLQTSLEQGLVSMEDIDRAVRYVLEAKYRLGLFDDPFKYNDVSRESTDIYNEATRAEARATAAKTFVLLKNEGSILPLAKKGKIALIGPLAADSVNMPGTWSLAFAPEKYKSLLRGFRDAVGDKAEILYAKGSNIYEEEIFENGIGIFGKGIRDSRSEQELLDEALKVAAEADVIVAAVGELAESSGESSSRTDLTLPPTQRRLLEALLATGKPVVMLNFAGRPTVMSWEAEHVPAILNVWFAGSEAADAIPDVVFGDATPTGRLPMTMPRNVGQIPLYYNHLNTSRPGPDNWQGFIKYIGNYVDSPNTPLYPFGYGLSYTTFAYSDFNLDSNEMTEDGTINASVTVTNTGSREDSEVVQFYIRDILGTLSRPVKELKYFERITLKPGESRTVTFPITVDALKYYHPADILDPTGELVYTAEPGEFQVMAGHDSATVETLSFTLK